MIDIALLRSRSSFEDEALGIKERFVRLPLGSGSTLGVVSTPIGTADRSGWVICHSFGPEQLYLNATEVAIARALAAAGSVVLRFHAQGYGDSQDLDTRPTPSTHLRDGLDAVARFPDVADADVVGTIGCRLGGSLAAIVAHRAGLPALVAVDPVVSGRRAVTNLLRTSVFEATAGGGADPASVEDLRQALANGSIVNVRGFGLHPEAAAELERLDLTTDVRGFAGSSLVIQVSRGNRTHREHEALAEALRSSGGRSVLELEPDATGLFGDHHFRAIADDVVADGLLELHASLAARIAGWVRTGFGSSEEVAG